VARSGIDVNLVVDVSPADPAERAELTLAALDLDGAWVTAREALTGEPDAYDKRLVEALENSDRLAPLPVLVPPTGAPGVYDRARRIAETASLRVVRLCPGSHGYPLAEWVVSPLPELCERAGMAVVLDFAPEPVPWPALVDFARTFPTLALVVVGTAVDEDRTLPAALDATPNLLFAVGRSTSEEALGQLCATFGQHRFVFGSDGDGDPSAVPAAIASALDEQARDAVLHENAAALAAGTYADTFLT